METAICISKIEKEYHVLFGCPIYVNLKNKFMRDSSIMSVRSALEARNISLCRSVLNFVLHTINRRRKKSWQWVMQSMIITVVTIRKLAWSLSTVTLQWGAANAEIKVPSGENTELKRSLFKVWSRSVYSHTCYAYCQEFLPRLFLPFRSIHLHFFQNLSLFFPVLAVANTGSCVGPQNKIGHPVGCRFPCWVPAEYK